MKKILIANRGEIARRVIATAQQMGIATVAVHSDADARAPHVHEATQAFALGGNTSAESYLRVDKLLAAARATGADAIHPGYGFLSEDAAFAQAVQDAGLVWIGPPPAAIRALGDKGAAKRLAVQQSVPVLPGYAGEDQSTERFTQEAEKIGYPLMVKAVAGGGGRGMRLVMQANDLPGALQSASSEALAGFGNGALLIERALMQPRHVEVQVFADAHGNAVHLFERDCSVQRRHQKIIEEAPSPAVSPALRARMGECAVALAQGAGYVGAGTVEFLLEGDNFYLMEMNTRLQVEHPVTEAITGLDLVEWQIRVARGEALPITQDQVPMQGHAIEVRLCAEDEHYTPHAGRIAHFAEPPGASHFARAPLRFDHAIEAGGEVTPFYDAMLGKLIVHAATREEAIDRLSAALAQTELLGLPTNRGFLMECLGDARFRAGQALISFLDEHGDALRASLLEKELSAHTAYGLAAVLPPLPLGEGRGEGLRPDPPHLAHPQTHLACPFAAPRRLIHREQVSTLAVWVRSGGVRITGPDGHARDVAVQPLSDGSLRCTGDGITQCVRAVPVAGGEGGQRWHAQAGGVDWCFEDVTYLAETDASQAQAAAELKAPFNGRVVRIAAQPGQALAQGEAAVVIESMKLEHSLAPRAAATVAELLVEVGQQVSPGQVLLRFAPPQPQEKTA
ncbi:biotin carboxylase N-terminal domain-containing protein [Comamonas sp. NLF-1-9]|uniref:acetyl/propionyl/methylcrotonyl-CoA carboxylase subunit alpha n=1 Tax=Comamonas sp. NLF-1-9 TaxID=2853163 RepID=UPI001C445BF1|nr:biotin carboxylase N-terminal domain-containing protein [Comamonas sp. NLF-1-9]QXL83523.1 biotin/lipoyl-binding protein [Comamonas sp. NLF-1-9]